MIHYGRQDINEEDIDSVVKVLRSDFLTQGPAVSNFERSVASQVGVNHAVALNSATSGLHVACLAMGLGRGDRLWTVPNTFVASANCGRYCGAEIDFVDIDPDTWNLSISKLKEKLFQAKKKSQLPKILVPVHFAGQPTEQEIIWELSQEYGFKVLEDASHSIGAFRNGEAVGSCRWSHITIFSFHPVKIITTGEGGMAVTNDGELAERMSMLRNHGITRDVTRFKDRGNISTEEQKAYPWYYEQQLLGFNYRMTDIQAILGISQLKRLTHYVERRNLLAQKYTKELQDLPLKLPSIQSGNLSSFHLYVVRLKGESSVLSQLHSQVIESLRKKGIGVTLHYMPVHLQPYYRDLGFAQGQYPESELHGKSAFSLPLYPALSDENQTIVINALRQVLTNG
ncbi:MAG: UDP-4-amino-4,6-dideoxy-N-acetyl-beta-L-altrosamine transaminase [Deltaproteobacteria bacterium]|nr:MAG: UDP-4-amino-4,6-dideoxy-N-acetyl-beta-L-altrosamine transaminase [Deltaproteobacteria bacterium]